MRTTATVAAILMLVACGGMRVELNNGTGTDLDSVTLTIGDKSETWQDLSRDQTFTTDIEISQGSLPFIVEWEKDGQNWSMDQVMIENAHEAKRISILFAPDEVSINYSF